MKRVQWLNKKEKVKVKLARSWLIGQIGDRIKTVADYSDMFQTGRGTVQQAMQELEDSKAIELVKRGTLGSFIATINYPLLWRMGGWEILTGACALPFTKRLEGITTGIYTAFEEKDVPFSFAYMQGAVNRVKGLIAEKYDFVLVSQGSADQILKDYTELEVALSFAPYSFLGSYAIVSKDERPWQSFKRIGRDLDSPDHVQLIERLWTDDVEFVDMQYTHMPRAIHDGWIDGTVFNFDSRKHWGMDADLCFRQMPAGFDVSEKSRAVLLTVKDNYGIATILRTFIDKDKVLSIQNDVLDNKYTPVY